MPVHSTVTESPEKDVDLRMYNSASILLLSAHFDTLPSRSEIGMKRVKSEQHRSLIIKDTYASFLPPLLLSSPCKTLMSCDDKTVA